MITFISFNVCKVCTGVWFCADTQHGVATFWTLSCATILFYFLNAQLMSPSVPIVHHQNAVITVLFILFYL